MVRRLRIAGMIAPSATWTSRDETPQGRSVGSWLLYYAAVLLDGLLAWMERYVAAMRQATGSDYGPR